MRLKYIYFVVLVAFSSMTAISQGTVSEDWYHQDFITDKVMGVSAHKAHEKLQGVKGNKIIVAIIDSGVDEDHEDLASVMWVNEDEIPGNGKDDDKNGYIDDIHGWNFIGGPNGDVANDNLEITRLYRKYHNRFAGVNPLTLEGDEKMDYAYYLTLKKNVLNERKKAKLSYETYLSRLESTKEAVKKFAEKAGTKTFDMDAIQKVDVGDDTNIGTVKMLLTNVLSSGEKTSLTLTELNELIEKTFGSAVNHFEGQYKYNYNPDFDPRSIVGDNYEDAHERYYGNNHYEGPDALHGTHVAGIVAADRTNENAMLGIADNVAIMTVRAVPNGDERDKDVANAIRYAVDNGASIINMSFGKGYVWNKDIVDDAVKYAAKNDVLLVHAAGNSSQDNDITDNFPNDTYNKAGWFRPKKAKNWIEVGALNFQQGENYPATFSNYGEKNVDLFAPGVQIYSTVPNDEYQYLRGTSMASPVVAGVAAIIRSHFPMLTAAQTKKILMESVIKIDDQVIQPGTDELVPFSKLSVSGGVVNAAKAVDLAKKTKGKRKSPIGDKMGA